METLASFRLLERASGGWYVEASRPATSEQLAQPYRIVVEFAKDADLNIDGVVDALDLGELLGDWGAGGEEDLVRDGAVDGLDLGMLLGAWGDAP